MIDRRTLMVAGTAFMFAGGADAKEGGGMYGLIGQMKAAPGKRAELAVILLEGTGAMPGCLSLHRRRGSGRRGHAVDHRGLGQPG
jgi:hypothetical protein